MASNAQPKGTLSLHSMTTFTILGSQASIMAPRLATLSIAGRKAISTPHYIPLTTRGAVPHIAHDVMRDHTTISSLYLGLEDCTSSLSEHISRGREKS